MRCHGGRYGTPRWTFTRGDTPLPWDNRLGGRLPDAGKRMKVGILHSSAGATVRAAQFRLRNGARTVFHHGPDGLRRSLVWPNITSRATLSARRCTLMGTMAAARTKRLRIGMAVSLAPFYNPLRLAEEVALLDVLSGGRVNWGAGRGFERSEFAAFGIPARKVLPASTRRSILSCGPGPISDSPTRASSTNTTGLVASQTIPDAASAGMDGGVLHTCHRLGGEQGPLDPDDPHSSRTT